MKVDQAEDAEGEEDAEKRKFTTETQRARSFGIGSSFEFFETLCPLCLCGKFLFSASSSPSAALSFAAGKQLGKELPVVTDSNSTIGKMYVFQI